MKTKKLFFPCLILAMIFVSCKKESKYYIEGTWQMVYGDWMSSDGSTFPAQIKGGQIKTWTKWNFSFVGQFVRGAVPEDTYGAGDYTLDGDRYTERLKYHYQKFYLKEDVRLLVEFKKDTLIQRWPVNKDWKLPKKYCIEKYVRLYK